MMDGIEDDESRGSSGASSRDRRRSRGIDAKDVLMSVATSLLISEVKSDETPGQPGEKGEKGDVGERGEKGEAGADGLPGLNGIAKGKVVAAGVRAYTALSANASSLVNVTDAVPGGLVMPNFDSATQSYTAPRDMTALAFLDINGQNSGGAGAINQDFIIRKNGANWRHLTRTLPPSNTDYFSITGVAVIPLKAGDVVDAKLRNNLTSTFNMTLRAWFVLLEITDSGSLAPQELVTPANVNPRAMTVQVGSVDLPFYEEGDIDLKAEGEMPGAVANMTARKCSYTRIGRKVSISGKLTWTGLGGSGALHLGPLPRFGAPYIKAGVGSGMTSNLTFPGNNVMVYAVMRSHDGGAIWGAWVELWSSVSGGAIQITPVDADGSLWFTLSYELSDVKPAHMP